MNNPENSSAEIEADRSERNHTLHKWGQQMVSFARAAQARAKSDRAAQGKPAVRLKPDDPQTMDSLDLIEALAERLIQAGGMLSGLGDSMPAIKQDIQKTTTEKVRRARSAALAKAGAKGGEGRGKRFSKLKEWAEREAAGKRGNASEIARQLMLKLPADLANVSDDPGRIIAGHLRAIRKPAKPASRNG
jgi:anti-sigma factor RsiW